MVRNSWVSNNDLNSCGVTLKSKFYEVLNSCAILEEWMSSGI